MYEKVENPKDNRSKKVVKSFARNQSDVNKSFGFMDNRPEVVAQRKLKSMVNNVQGEKEKIQQQKPIQMMIWTSSGGSWEPTDWGSVDYKIMPKGDKPEGTTYDDATGIFTYPAEEEGEKVDDSPAGLERRERIQPFLDLMDHLAAENDGSTSKGGHLLLAMEAKWGDDFNLDNSGDKNNAGVWHAQWSIKGKKKAGGSTMFPASWTKDTLRAELMASSSISGKIILQPSNIQIKKAGGTFYPDV